MAIEFNPQQQQVIDLHKCNILVSAAAGSGKTAVLVERIIQMICNETDKVDIDRLLVVTFTNAAAAEMRERVGKAIEEKLAEHPESVHLQRQSALIHNAQITTIDSFCLFLIRNHFNEIGLDPDFRVADSGEVKMLQKETVEELLEEAYAEHSEEFLQCVDYFCQNGSDRNLEERILKMANFAQSFPWPKAWLEEHKKDYDVSFEEFENSPIGVYLLNFMRKMVEGFAEQYGEWIRICEMPNGPYMYGQLLEDEKEQLEKLLSVKTLREMEVAYGAVNFGKLSSKKDDSVSKELREYISEERKDFKKKWNSAIGDYFDVPYLGIDRQNETCSGPVKTLLSLCISFLQRLEEKKKEKKLLDFSDMEHYALDILGTVVDGKMVPSPVAMEYRQYFHEIMVDEYQDSNLVQESLLSVISGEEIGVYNRFMVGDIKQSIYRFRQARPELFLEKYLSYEDTGLCRRIDLTQNYRSRYQVLDSVNQIFEKMMVSENGGVEYDEKARLNPGADYEEAEGYETECLLVHMEKADDKENCPEAKAVAQRIHELLGSLMVTDKETKELRPMEYRDVVILVRKLDIWEDFFKPEFERQGIPVYVPSKSGYFAASEVQQVLQFLRMIDNPTVDISMFGVMKSIFGGFTLEEIATIRAGHKEESLYTILLKCAGEAGDSESPETDAEEIDFDKVNSDGRTIEISKELLEKIRNFLAMIRRYRKYTMYMTIREILQNIMEEFDYIQYVTALPAGGKRRANVEMLLTKASEFEKSSYFGLFHFVQYIEQLERLEVDYGEADILDEFANVVKVMTIHKSKGLEFPVVFAVGLNRQFNFSDTTEAVLTDTDFGVAIDYVDTTLRVKNKTLRKMTLANKMKEDMLAEEMRVLYVALTRAKEKLILSGTLDKMKDVEMAKILQKKKLSYLDFISARCYLDFLKPILPSTDIVCREFESGDLMGDEVQKEFAALEKRNALREALKYANASDLEELKTRFAYEYPHDNLKELYTKTTVSELKIAAMAGEDEEAFHAFEEAPVVPYIPAFKREEETVTGTVRGNAYHKVMELMDFDKVYGVLFPQFPETFAEFQAEMEQACKVHTLEQALKEQLLSYVEDGRLLEEYYEAIRLEKVIHFLQTELSYRMWRADRKNELYREQPFVLGIPAKRLREDFPEDEKVLIQGIIDAFFVEEDGIVLLDYKTDKIESLEALWKRYRTQIDYYTEALVRLMNKPVKEGFLYSYNLEEYQI